MKFPTHQPLLPLCSDCRLQGGHSHTAEKKVASEVKHEVTIGGKDVKNPIAYTPTPPKKAASTSSITARSATGSTARVPAFPSPPKWTRL